MKHSITIPKIAAIARAMEAVEASKPPFSLRAQLRWAGARKGIFAEMDRINELARKTVGALEGEEARRIAAEKLDAELSAEVVELDLPAPITADLITGPIDAPLSAVAILIGPIIAAETEPVNGDHP